MSSFPSSHDRIRSIPSRSPFQSSANVDLSIAHCVGKTFIIAYKESTALLEQTLTQTGLNCEVLRQEPKPDYQAYAAIYRCMLNHQRAWQRAAAETTPTLIVEADFVPVVGMGKLPLPFDLHQNTVGIAWLYTCAPQLYSVNQRGFAEGFSTGLVAYILTPAAAAVLCGLVDEVTEKHGTGYYNFDSDVDEFLRSRQFKNYIPFRNYGEHGGIANPEHRRNNMSGIHRADVLYNDLAFTPLYASGKPSLAILFRLRARAWGIARLLSGKFLRLEVLRQSSIPLRLIRFAIGRQLSGRL